MNLARQTGVLRPWQVWLYTLSLLASALLLVSFIILLLFEARIRGSAVLWPGMLLVWALTLLASLPLRVWSLMPAPGLSFLRNRDNWCGLSDSAWKYIAAGSLYYPLLILLAPTNDNQSLLSSIFGLSILPPADENLESVWSTVLSLLKPLAGLASALCVIYVSLCSEHRFIELAGLRRRGRAWLLNSGRVVFYIANPILGAAYLWTAYTDRRDGPKPAAEVHA